METSNSTQTNGGANFSTSSINTLYHCVDSIGEFISTAYVITHISFILPLSLLVFYLGFQRWRQQRSIATTSHSDVFTYNSAAIELIFALGVIFDCCGKYLGLSELTYLGFYFSCVFLPGQISFHVLTCVERYLAAVHPVIYVGLRQSEGVRIRNISIGCAWLLSCGWIGVHVLYYPNIPYLPLFCLWFMSLAVVSFCSISVLCVLIHPGPGEMVGNRKLVDHAKQRAFNTITAIMAVLSLFFLATLVSVALDGSQLLSYSDGCLVLTAGTWFSLPTSLVLPLLFLHRARKLVCCRCSNDLRPSLH